MNALAWPYHQLWTLVRSVIFIMHKEIASNVQCYNV